MCPESDLGRNGVRRNREVTVQELLLTGNTGPDHFQLVEGNGPNIPHLTHLMAMGRMEFTTRPESTDISQSGQDSEVSGRSSPSSTGTGVTEVIDPESEEASSSTARREQEQSGTQNRDGFEEYQFHPESPYEVIGFGSGIPIPPSVNNYFEGFQQPPMIEGQIDVEGMHQWNQYRRSIITAPQQGVILPQAQIHQPFQPYPIALPPPFQPQGPIPIQVPMPFPQPQQNFVQYGQPGQLLVQQSRGFAPIQHQFVPQSFPTFTSVSIPTTFVEPRPVHVYEGQPLFYNSSYAPGCDIQQQSYGGTSNIHHLGVPPLVPPSSFEMNNQVSDGLRPVNFLNYEDFSASSYSGQESYWSDLSESQSESQIPFYCGRTEEGELSDTESALLNSVQTQPTAFFHDYDGNMQQHVIFNGMDLSSSVESSLASSMSSMSNSIESTSMTSFDSLSSGSDDTTDDSAIGQPRDTLQDTASSDSFTARQSQSSKIKVKAQRHVNKSVQNNLMKTVTYIIDRGTTFYMNGQELPYVINAWDPSSKMNQKPPKNYEYYVPPTMEDGDFFGGQQAMFQIKMMQYFGKYRPDIWKLQAVPDFHRSPTDGWISFNITTKLRFCCRNCKVPWTSKKGKVVFAFTLDSASRRGWIFMKMFGQVCMRKDCKDWGFQTPACYPEEIDRALYKLFEIVSYVYYGLPLDLSIFAECEKSIRVGYPKSRHRKEFCQACQQGICQAAQVQ